ncbi:MAG: 3-dehydro-L-gulonate 2-dehydrogenase [Bryobacteraceae bacterium]|jgi:3-dehydro-L-gulonate 2-dehydrogenase
MMRVPYETVAGTLAALLEKLGFVPAQAALCARLFADTTRDGVYSHGLNRFPRFVATIRNGEVDPGGRPVRVAAHGVLERWDGRRGPGNCNAVESMDRAMTMARQSGVGCVALANTTHWMRGGAYGWQAAEAGMMAICWTNTMPNLPPWGSAENRIGNNPLVLAVPRAAGQVVLDIAMSQFSYGAVEGYRDRGEELPVYGGFDSEGRLTRDAAAIVASQRHVPIGYWKGSGLSVLLDMFAALLSGGRATYQVPPDPLREGGVSQVFLAFDPSQFRAAAELERMADAIVASLGEVRYPGEQVLRTRAENLAEGLPIEEALWRRIESGSVLEEA